MMYTDIASKRSASLLSLVTVQLALLTLAVTFSGPVFRMITGGEIQPPTAVAALANLVAVVIAFSIRRSLTVYPGSDRFRFMLPAVLSAHALIWLALIMLRLPYDRVTLGLGLFLHIFIEALVLSRHRVEVLQIALVPQGDTTRVEQLDKVAYVPIDRADLSLVDRNLPIVADFRTDLSPEWELFLAEAALEGRAVLDTKKFSELVTGRVSIEHLSENNFGSLVPVRVWYELKAAIDFFAALVLLPIALVPMAMVALAIRLDDGGPAIFRQERVGRGGKPFTLYKFRTMGERKVECERSDAETADDDRRITRIGKLLRKFRLDELPQLFNVLKGEMSFIGPRPEPRVLVDWYLEELSFYRYRHIVRPGITGWAAVNQGHVNGLDKANVKLEYDFYYIKHFSPWLDLLVAVMTLRTIVTGRGAR